MNGWRGEPARYGAISPIAHAGGGSVQSRPTGRFAPITPGVAGGGGRVPSTGQVCQGYGGCGGPGPGAMIGLR